jgi:hypothetical protein
MVKIPLSGISLTLTVVTAKGTNKIEILNGFYKNRQYTTLTLIDKTLVLSDNTGDVVIASDIVMLSIYLHRVRDHVSRILGNQDVYLYGINAVPEGKEREILEKLL